MCIRQLMCGSAFVSVLYYVLATKLKTRESSPRTVMQWDCHGTPIKLAGPDH